MDFPSQDIDIDIFFIVMILRRSHTCCGEKRKYEDENMAFHRSLRAHKYKRELKNVILLYKAKYFVNQLFFHHIHQILMETLQAQEELAFIRKIIAESRATFVEDGKPYIIWGILVALAMGMTYFSVLTQTELYVG